MSNGRRVCPRCDSGGINHVIYPMMHVVLPEQTNACENITSTQLPLWVVTKHRLLIYIVCHSELLPTIRNRFFFVLS